MPKCQSWGLRSVFFIISLLIYLSSLIPTSYSVRKEEKRKGGGVYIHCSQADKRPNWPRWVRALPPRRRQQAAALTRSCPRGNEAKSHQSTSPIRESDTTSPGKSALLSKPNCFSIFIGKRPDQSFHKMGTNVHQKELLGLVGHPDRDTGQTMLPQACPRTEIQLT